MKVLISCRSCKGSNLDKFLDLGNHYVSDFRNDRNKPNSYPLQAMVCEDCKLVQLRHTVPSGDMYHENYGFKSGISDSIKNDLKDNVESLLRIKPSVTKWLDIASNDGTLLSFVPSTITRTGVDPIAKYCKEATQHADRIVCAFFDARYFGSYGDVNGVIYEKFDAITSISCFYDMDDPNKFVGDVAKILDKNGVWDIQQNYLLTTLELGAVDNFCFEHLEYYTLLSLEPLLERHGLEVIDATTSMVNGGSLRTFVAHKGAFPVQDSVERQRTIEYDARLQEVGTYYRFAEKANENLNELRQTINTIRDRGQTIAVLAASTRGATIWQAIELTDKDVLYAVERNPEKVGKRFSAIGIDIVSEDKFHADKPDYALVGPWFFAFPEIVDREKNYIEEGGALIIPLPKVRIIEKASNLVSNL